MLIICTENETLETRRLNFTRKNIEKIAYHYDAIVESFDISIKHAMLRDRRNRVFWVDGK